MPYRDAMPLLPHDSVTASKALRHRIPRAIALNLRILRRYSCGIAEAARLGKWSGCAVNTLVAEMSHSLVTALSIRCPRSSYNGSSSLAELRMTAPPRSIDTNDADFVA